MSTDHISWGVTFAVGAALLWSFFGPRPSDDTDPPGGRSGLGLYTDARTGCQYLTRPGTGITPRVDREGKHICDGGRQ